MNERNALSMKFRVLSLNYRKLCEKQQQEYYVGFSLSLFGRCFLFTLFKKKEEEEEGNWNIVDFYI